MLVVVAMLLIALLIAVLLTVAATLLFSRFVGNRGAVFVLSGLLLPLLICFSSIGVFVDQSVDGPPPGMVLEGVYLLAALVTPVTLMASAITLRFRRMTPSRVKVG